MSWPQSHSYSAAIQNPRICFADPRLQALQAVTDTLGLPRVCSGNFAVVFVAEHPKSGHRSALKCFTREVPGLQARYRAISQHLRQAKLSCTVEFEYLEPGILVEGGWYPLVRMDWIQGESLPEFVEASLKKPERLERLAAVWVRLAQQLKKWGTAHGDLQHGNVLLVPGDKSGQVKLRLIDYDGMYVPALSGSRSNEVGHPNFQHPERIRTGTFNAEVDRFSHLVIYTALRCLAVRGAGLWTKYNNQENLLFRKEDYESPGSSPLFQELWAQKDPAVRALAGRLILACSRPVAQVPLLDDLLVQDQPRPLSGAEESEVSGLLSAGKSRVRQIPKHQPQPPRIGTQKATPKPPATWPPSGLPGWVQQNRQRPAGTTTTNPLPPGFDLRQLTKPLIAAGAVCLASLLLILLGNVDWKWLGATSSPAAAAPTGPVNLAPTLSIDGAEPEEPVVGGPLKVRLRGYDREGVSLRYFYREAPEAEWAELPGAELLLSDLKEGPLHLEFKVEDAGALASPVIARDWYVAPPNPYLAWRELDILRVQGQVNSLAFSPSGALLAAGGDTPEVQLWRMDNGQLAQTLEGHTGPVNCVAFSPDGRMLATGSDDKTVRVWDVFTGECPGTFKVAPRVSPRIFGGVTAVAFDARGEHVLSACNDDCVRIWRIADGTLIRGPHNRSYEHFTFDGSGGLRGAAFNASGNTAVLVGDGHAWVDLHVWRIENNRPAKIEKRRGGGLGEMLELAVSPDGSRIATPSMGSVAILKVGGGKDETVTIEVPMESGLAPHLDTVTCATFDPTSRYLAVGDVAGTIGVWRIADQKSMATFQGHATAVTELAFSPEGQLLASAGRDSTVRLWGAEPPTNAPPSLEIVSLEPAELHLGDSLMVSLRAEDRERDALVYEYRVPYDARGEWHSEAEPTFPVPVPVEGSMTVEFRVTDSNGQSSAVLSRSFDVLPSPWREVGSITYANFKANNAPRGSGVSQMCFHPDGRTLFIAAGTYVQMWQAHERKLLTQWNVAPHRRSVDTSAPRGLRLAVSPDGKTLATTYCGCEDNSIGLWSVPGAVQPAPPANPDRILTGPTKPGTSLAFSPDGRYLASGCEDGGMRVWKLPKGEIVRQFNGGYGPFLFAAFLDETTLVGGDTDGDIHAWDVSSGESKGFLRPETEWRCRFASSPSGMTVAAAGARRISKSDTAIEIRLWNLETKQEPRVLRSSLSDVESLSFSPNGKLLALVGGRTMNPSYYNLSEVEIWSTETGHRQVRLATETRDPIAVNALAFSQDGRLLATGSHDEIFHIKFWTREPGETAAAPQ